jgi:hypothetical protein
MFIPDPNLDIFPIQDPGVKKAPDPGSGSAKLLLDVKDIKERRKKSLGLMVQMIQRRILPSIYLLPMFLLLSLSASFTSLSEVSSMYASPDGRPSLIKHPHSNRTVKVNYSESWYALFMVLYEGFCHIKGPAFVSGSLHFRQNRQIPYV